MANLLSFYYKAIKEQNGARKANFFYQRYLLFFPHFSKWVNYIHNEYLSNNIGFSPIEPVRTKFSRFYYSKDVNIKNKFLLLKNHYEFAKSILKEDAYKKLLAGQDIPIAKIIGKSLAEYHIVMSQHDRFRHEGEITIQLVENIGDDFLSALTFLFSGDKENPTILVGGIQGHKSESAKERIKEITKDLHGLRPKSIILEALYGIIPAVNAKYVEAVCFKNHALTDNKRALYSDYDAFFQEITDKTAKNGNYILPLEMPHRDVSEVASKKRKAWLAKEEIKRSINNQVEQTFKSLMK